MQAEVIDLKALSKQELEEKYQQVFGYSAPKGYTKSYLIKELVWHEKYQNLPKELQHKLDLLVSDYEKTKSVNVKKIRNFEVTSGTKFIREYKGERYEVTAVENGFQYKNQTYKTLSAVANVITGTHWNGRKFFGVGNG